MLKRLLPILVALLVVGVTVGVAPWEKDTPSRQGWTQPRFVVTADSWGADSSAWFQVYETAEAGKEKVVDAVQPPSPAAGKVTGIVAGPASMFVVAAWDIESCTTSLYRFTLSDDGHASDLRPVTRVGSLAAGLAISPDGRRIAYATGACGTEPEGSPPAGAPISLTVLDMSTGQDRTWTSAEPVIVGDIVWAGDNRTIGYTTAGILPDAAVGIVQVHATDTESQDDDLLSGRLLFTQADPSDMVNTAVMGADGRTGYGALRKEQPPSTVLFTFGEGKPVHVTKTIPDDPNSVSLMSFAGSDDPRYACLGGIDAFGRVDDNELTDDALGSRQCSAAYAPPY